MADDPTDYDGVMQANLQRVFSERDAGRRLVAIEELYAADAILHEPHASVAGHASISAAVTELLASLPPDLVFTPLGPAIGHHAMARLRWQSGSSGPLTVTGTDVATFREGRIQTLHVFLDPPSA